MTPKTTAAGPVVAPAPMPVPAALLGTTNAHQQARRQARADRLLQAALRLTPDNQGLRLEWARRLRLTHRPREAVAALRLVLRQNPFHAEALLELGGVLMLLGAFEAARKRYALLLAMQPQHRLALYNQAQAQGGLGLIEEAVQSAQAALALDPNATEVLCQCEYLRLTLCDWADYAQRMAALQERLEAHHLRAVGAPLPPLLLQSFPLPLALHRRLAQDYADAVSAGTQALAAAPLNVFAGLSPGATVGGCGVARPIRLAYLSADFCDHPMGHLIHGLFAHHNRAQFEVFAYSLSATADAFSASVRRGVDHFCDASAMDAQTLAQRLRADGIEVLIDLMGFTRQSCPTVLAMRPVPLQLLYLGYPGTMGADFIDGVIADPWLIPPHLAHGYRETVYHLPCAFVWSAPPEGRHPGALTAARQVARSALGLPAQAVVYACFNRAHKLDPNTFDVWLRILQQVPHSVLWLIQSTPLVQQRLRTRASEAGLDPARLVFTPYVPSEQFEAVCSLADLYLDTLHYGAGATGVVALRAGVPLLTRPGETFTARMGASLCAATGLQALICDSEQAYQDKAVALGQDPSQLVQLRCNLLAQQANLPLFKTAQWVAQLEGLLWRLARGCP